MDQVIDVVLPCPDEAAALPDHPLELLLRAGAAGWRLHEVEVSHRPRTGGRSKVSGSVRGTLRAVRDMVGVLR